MEQRVINPADNFILDRMTDLTATGQTKIAYDNLSHQVIISSKKSKL